MRQYDLKATNMFIFASAALLVNAVITGVQAVVSLPSGLNIFLQIIALTATVFAYVIIIRAFGDVNRACKLSEENENYYLGKNLTVLSVLSLILTLIFTVAVVFLRMLLSKYAEASSLTPTDVKAANNISIILSLVLIAAQASAVSTPIIMYLWKIHKYTPKSDSVNNFALLTMIIMLVHLAIGILNPLYSIKGSDTGFLASFSRVLLIIQYIVLLLFFITRRKGIATSLKENTDTDEADGEEHP